MVVGGVLPEIGVTYYDVPQTFGATPYRYTVVNGQTVLVEPRSAVGLAGAIGRLARDRAALSRMSAAARATIAARYSVERLAADLCRLYARLSARAASRRIARA